MHTHTMHLIPRIPCAELWWVVAYEVRKLAQFSKFTGENGSYPIMNLETMMLTAGPLERTWSCGQERIMCW